MEGNKDRSRLPTFAFFSRPNRSGDGQQRSEQALRTLVIIMAIGLLGVVVYAMQNQTILMAAASGVLIGGASLMLGGFLGFLFGIPRTLQGEAEGVRGTEYRANTNLEQISDWLTKILVGVGLTQVGELPRSFEVLGAFIVEQSGGAIPSSTYAIAIVLFFLLCGFLFGYLWTRLLLPGAFREADDFTVLITNLKQQPEFDSRAMDLVGSQLEPRPDTKAPDPVQLREAIAKASAYTRQNIYDQARRLRKENWQVNKELMETTIPIFRALIASDPDNNNHQYRGQLGFALRDKRDPAYSEAAAMLTEAITIRGDPAITGYRYYELTRSICRIMLDANFIAGKPSTAQARKNITDDLRACVTELEPLMPIKEIDEWMKLNNITMADLKK